MISVAPQPAVWVTRPQEGGRQTARTLRAAGFCVVQAPVLDISLVPARPPPGPWPDWVILVSANAARGLAAARASGALPNPGAARPRIAVVGRRTAEQAARVGLEADLVPAEESAAGLVAALAAERLEGCRIWIPAGNREGSATRELPRALAAAGAVAVVFQVYETTSRRLAPSHLAQLTAVPPGAVVLHSPSAADAVFQERQPACIAPWRERAVAVAIGAPTRARLAVLGAKDIRQCPEPSDAGVIAALASIPSLRALRTLP